MSGYLRLCFAAFFLLAGLSTAPASSNPFATLFGQTAPAEATSPAPVEEECLPRPGKSTADGQHWVYRLDGHRKCWFQAAAGTIAKKPVHQRATKHVAAPKEAASRKPNAVVDARAELRRSTPADTPQPAPPAPEFKMVDADPLAVPAAGALMPPAPVVAKRASDQLTPDHPTPRQVDVQVDVETLLAAAPAAGDAVAVSVSPATSVAGTAAEGGDDKSGWTATWLGALLMVLGFAFLLSSSRSLRAVLSV
jgi:hypothetical protein